MFAIEVNLLTKRYYASDGNNKHEWPPHPARLFFALVATWVDADNPSANERATLEWLEKQDPPKIVASRASYRNVLNHFVPVNDPSLAELLPDDRKKIDRTFPSVTPVCPRVTYVWNAEPTLKISKDFCSLLSRLTRLGHTASLVSCVMRLESPDPNWIPGDYSLPDGRLRWVRQGQLACLVDDYKIHKGEPQGSLPSITFSYKKLKEDSDEKIKTAKPSTSGECLFFKFEVSPDSPLMPSTQVARLTDTFRKAVLSYADKPIHECISGHLPDGSPSRAPHVVFAAVPNVGVYGDGRMMGMLMIVPRDPFLDDQAQQAAFKAIANWEEKATGKPLKLALGSGGAYDMQHVIGDESGLATLRRGTWAEPSKRWMSVTPIALPKHPGDLRSNKPGIRDKAWAKAEAAVEASCKHVDLPKPKRIDLSLDPFWLGSRPAGAFPAFRQGKGSARRLVHATIEFDHLVEGPLLLGAGRYRGLGLMRPDNPKKTSGTTKASENTGETSA